MRYASLHIMSVLYRLVGVFGALLTIALFITGIADNASLPPSVRAQAAFYGYSVNVVLAFIILIVGALGSLTSYAIGEFIMLMIDIEQGVRNIDNHFNGEYYPPDQDPLTPRPLADFPPSRFSNRPARTPEQVRRPGKWDMGK